MSKKGIIIISAVAFVFMALVGGGFFMMWMKIASLMPPEEIVEEVIEEEEEEEVIIGEMFPLETFVVNLADPKGKRYLRTTLQLELTPEQTVETLEQRLPQIRDIILTVLPTKQSQEIRTVDGKTMLRAEIMRKLNDLFGAESIANIYFTEFVIQ
jgi:flagellar FliL protein